MPWAFHQVRKSSSMNSDTSSLSGRMALINKSGFCLVFPHFSMRRYIGLGLRIFQAACKRFYFASVMRLAMEVLGFSPCGGISISSFLRVLLFLS